MQNSNRDDDDWREIVAMMREARDKSRGYATYWEWTIDRSLVEVEVARALAGHLSHTDGCEWLSVEQVTDDPPDVLLVRKDGARIGVEVTELVDPEVVKRHQYWKKMGLPAEHDWAPWTDETLQMAIAEAVKKKDKKLAARASAYDLLFLAIATDEPMIGSALAERVLETYSVAATCIDRAFMILSYDPGSDGSAFPTGIPVFPITID